jgi:predicted nucleic acid-binding protein
MVCDTSALIAFFNGADPDHDSVVTVLRAARPPLVVGPLVLAEFDYLVRTRVGDDPARRAVGALLGGRFEVASCAQSDVAAALAIDAQYAALDIGLTDASLVALAGKYRTLNLATLDERHFRAVRPLFGGPAFRILPADA